MSRNRGEAASNGECRLFSWRFREALLVYKAGIRVRVDVISSTSDSWTDTLRREWSSNTTNTSLSVS